MRKTLNEDTGDSVVLGTEFKDYMWDLTPIEQKSDGMYYKREDKFALSKEMHSLGWYLQVQYEYQIQDGPFLPATIHLTIDNANTFHIDSFLSDLKVCYGILLSKEENEFEKDAFINSLDIGIRNERLTETILKEYE